MEAKTDTQTYMEQGDYSLAHGQAREAAIAYAHAAQIERNNPAIHLGLAEANLGLGNLDIVRMACAHVQELQPTGGIESIIAQALLDLLDRHYDRALQKVDTAIAQNPGIAYLHAIRSYLLRLNHQDYDANLARARSARLSYGGRFDGMFPQAEPLPYATQASYNGGYSGVEDGASTTGKLRDPEAQARVEREVPTWSPPNGMQRQVIRTRFALSQYPGLITYALIIINVIIFAFSYLNPNLLNAGAQVNGLVEQGEYWRLFTAMFLHLNIVHIGFNMLSLFFVGRGVEVFYGKWRYLVIYLLSGIAGGILFLFTAGPGGAAVGASGAIFGVFGALGVFYIVNRRSLGAYGRGAIGNWLFWIGLNLVFGLTNTDIALTAHIGGLIAGMLLAFVLVPRYGGSRRI